VQDAPLSEKKSLPLVNCQRFAPLVRWYLAGWGLPALAAGITAAATLTPSSHLGIEAPIGISAKSPLKGSHFWKGGPRMRTNDGYLSSVELLDP